MTIPINITGRRFGRLVALSIYTPPKTKNPMWLFRCDCGKEKVIQKGVVKAGIVKSCGCLGQELRRGRAKHRMSSSSEYRSWRSMKGRCYNPNNIRYKHYGERGIKIYESWISDFEAFYNYMGPKPSPYYSIDRINNDGYYEPGNVIWSLPKAQNNNKRQRGSKLV